MTSNVLYSVQCRVRAQYNDSNLIRGGTKSNIILAILPDRVYCDDILQGLVVFLRFPFMCG